MNGGWNAKRFVIIPGILSVRRRRSDEGMVSPVGNSTCAMHMLLVKTEG